jgi:hypothetical protein
MRSQVISGVRPCFQFSERFDHLFCRLLLFLGGRQLSRRSSGQITDAIGVGEAKMRGQLAERGGRVMMCEVGGQVSPRRVRASLAVLFDRDFKLATSKWAATALMTSAADGDRRRRA